MACGERDGYDGCRAFCYVNYNLSMYIANCGHKICMSHSQQQQRFDPSPSFIVLLDRKLMFLFLGFTDLHRPVGLEYCLK